MLVHGNGVYLRASNERATGAGAGACQGDTRKENEAPEEYIGARNAPRERLACTRAIVVGRVRSQGYMHICLIDELMSSTSSGLAALLLLPLAAVC